MILNPNEEIKRLLSLGDKIAEKITDACGSAWFLGLNVIVFAGWLLVNQGVFGERYIFDPYPFGFLTLAVSLEAIFLAIFVLITQNRQAKVSDIRSELDYRTNLQTQSDTDVVLRILERLASKQNIDVSDLAKQVTVNRRRVSREHPVDQGPLPPNAAKSVSNNAPTPASNTKTSSTDASQVSAIPPIER